MGDEAANSMNLDLNLDPIPEPENALSNGSVSLEEFIGGVNGLRGSLRQREILRLRRANDVDLLRDRLRPREMHPLARSDSVDQLRERLRQQEIQSLRRSDVLDRIGDIVTVRERRRSIWRRATVLPEIVRNDAPEVMINPIIDPRSSFLSGETSVTPLERDTEPLKVTQNNNEINVENEELGEKGNEDKGKYDDTGSFFDCNICLDLAKDAVVTCCGHLFCWPCVYQWLNLHSVANECPVCKGEVTMKNVIPIYGRGKSPCGPEQDPPGPMIPVRPHARRVESARQSIHRNSVSISMDELVRRLSERRGIVWRDQVASGADQPLSRDPSSERIVSYFLGRDREEQPPPLDDRDSVSSIAAVIQSESQTIDTVLEIDSNVSLSTSTSRRRIGNVAPRASDVDSGDLRAHRRRRVN